MALDRPLKRAAVELPGKDHADLSSPRQKPENRHFSAGTSTTLALAIAAKVALIDLHMPGELFQLPLGLSDDGLTQKRVIAQDRLAAKTHIGSGPGDRHQQPEEPHAFADLGRHKPSGRSPGGELSAASPTLSRAIGEAIASAATAGRAAKMTRRNPCHKQACSFVTPKMAIKRSPVGPPALLAGPV
jgi:hypothetical protein